MIQETINKSDLKGYRRKLRKFKKATLDSPEYKELAEKYWIRCKDYETEEQAKERLEYWKQSMNTNEKDKKV
jgi:hypothetical protein